MCPGAHCLGPWTEALPAESAGPGAQWHLVEELVACLSPWGGPHPPPSPRGTPEVWKFFSSDLRLQTGNRRESRAWMPREGRLPSQDTKRETHTAQVRALGELVGCGWGGSESVTNILRTRAVDAAPEEGAGPLVERSLGLARQPCSGPPPCPPPSPHLVGGWLWCPKGLFSGQNPKRGPSD